MLHKIFFIVLKIVRNLFACKRSITVLGVAILFFSSPVFAAMSADEDETFMAYEAMYTSQDIYDPYENLNRKVYIMNDVLDRYFLERMAKLYRKTMPEEVRDAVHNCINNLSFPVSALNSFLQGRVDNGLATFSNFLINSTVGIFGLFDIAGRKGIYYRLEDFGQTLGHYGTGPGAYLMIPVLGPSTIRDLSGLAADRIASPIGLNVFELGRKSTVVPVQYLIGIVIVSGIDTRENLLDVVDDIRKNSFDPYATIRSAYLQKRINDIKN